MQQINFTGYLERLGNTVIFSFFKKQKKTFRIFFESIENLFYFNIILI